MIYFSKSLNAWNTANFNDVLKKEIADTNPDLLPLQQGLIHSSYANGSNLSASILKVENNEKNLQVKAGLFYTGIIAGCNCADDPTPVDENNEYCEVLFSIDKKTALTTVSFIS